MSRRPRGPVNRPGSRRMNAGRDESEPQRLRLATGVDDDLRRVLEPGHELWPMALLAWRHQDGWSLEEHRRLMAAVVEVWPKQPGRRSVVETLAWWAGQLRADGFSDDEIA